MASLRILYIMTLTCIFKVMKFELWISRKRWKLAKMLKYIFDRGWYSPSNGTFANFAHRDLDLNFQGHTFETLIFRKRWELPQKCITRLWQRLVFAIEWHHNECCTQWRWPSFSRSDVVLLSICYKKNCAGSGCPRNIFASTRTAPPWSCYCQILFITIFKSYDITSKITTLTVISHLAAFPIYWPM